MGGFLVVLGFEPGGGSRRSLPPACHRRLPRAACAWAGPRNGSSPTQPHRSIGLAPDQGGGQYDLTWRAADPQIQSAQVQPRVATWLRKPTPYRAAPRDPRRHPLPAELLDRLVRPQDGRRGDRARRRSARGARPGAPARRGAGPVRARSRPRRRRSGGCRRARARAPHHRPAPRASRRAGSRAARRRREAHRPRRGGCGPRPACRRHHAARPCGAAWNRHRGGR